MNAFTLSRNDQADDFYIVHGIHSPFIKRSHSLGAEHLGCAIQRTRIGAGLGIHEARLDDIDGRSDHRCD